MKKVLVVEDEMAIARVIAAYLQKEHYEVVTVHDGAEAVEVFDRVQPHLVLLDIHLPGMDGWEILTYIREKERVPCDHADGLIRNGAEAIGLESWR